MRATHTLWCLRRSHSALARRGHGGTAHTQRELERLALLEKKMMQHAEMRAQEVPKTTTAFTAAYLRELPQRVERMRSVSFAEEEEVNDGQKFTEHSAAGASDSAAWLDVRRKSEHTSGDVISQEITTLSQFISACKKYRIEYGSTTDPASRRQGREVLRTFWNQYASSALACCHKRVCDLGIVADIGLADSGLHIGVRDMRSVLHVLQTSGTVASSLDVSRILGYLARELHYWECRKGSENGGDALPARGTLIAFREALTDVALERLASIFVEQSPPSEKSTPDHLNMATNTPETSDSIAQRETASGIDAVWGLEVLSILHARDATEGVLENLWRVKQLGLLRPKREPANLRSTSASLDDSSATMPMRTLANEVQYLLVSELFRVVAVRRRDLRMTDIVHAYALLRVHLRLLWPPYGQQQQPHRSHGNATAKGDQSNAVSAPGPAPRRRLTLWYEKDTLFRVAWGLAVALASKDRVFISGYHFVKIVATLAKLPAFVLSPEPHAKRELHSFEIPRRDDLYHGDAGDTGGAGARLVSATIAAEVARQEMTAEATPKPMIAVALHPRDFWRFIVAKACVFVPSLPAEQRRVVCRSLHLAITEKRANLLRLDTGATFHAARVPRSARLVQGGSSGRLFGSKSTSPDGSGTASAMEILRPLVEEMEDYPEPYEACRKNIRAHSPPPRATPRKRPKRLQ
ncbi:hypothetical protein JKF63_02950 [Porcisia hertigi]|uniref:Uncharacterized protein n=1 Tax=Porcisia hertigi TaxID=2761500 RepID=A0A836L543_9TRYP|nr:hypothetical protein JKF63_02950 [Porcisia hertigi]